MKLSKKARIFTATALMSLSAAAYVFVAHGPMHLTSIRHGVKRTGPENGSVTAFQVLDNPGAPDIVPDVPKAKVTSNDPPSDSDAAFRFGHEPISAYSPADGTTLFVDDFKPEANSFGGYGEPMLAEDFHKYSVGTPTEEHDFLRGGFGFLPGIGGDGDVKQTFAGIAENPSVVNDSNLTPPPAGNGGDGPPGYHGPPPTNTPEPGIAALLTMGMAGLLGYSLLARRYATVRQKG